MYRKRPTKLDHLFANKTTSNAKTTPASLASDGNENLIRLDGKPSKKQKVKTTNDQNATEDVIFFEDHSRMDETADTSQPSVSSTTGSVAAEAKGTTDTTTATAVPQCRYGMNCKKPYCKFKHDGVSAVTTSTEVVPHIPKKPCRFGTQCKKQGCTFLHEATKTTTAQEQTTSVVKNTSDGSAKVPQHLRPCRFGLRCSKPGCPFNHGEEKTTASTAVNETTNNANDDDNLSLSLPSTPPELRHKKQ
eukprot:TRINITY_DN14182_c0_g1_i1.p1 TRINITY_DN14182_c0_g1~~TRINITY_DN14182_c0_g1_i1.p1  ORF type:complete len:254 (-),score=43.03 TRINITY_DN14182_c0_g1_i1:97-837(-)